MDLSSQERRKIAMEENAKSDRLSYLSQRMCELLGDSSYEELNKKINNLPDESEEKITLMKTKDELDNIFKETNIIYYNSLIDVLKELPYAKEKRFPELYQLPGVDNLPEKTVTLSQFKLEYNVSLDNIQTGDWVKLGNYPFYVYGKNNELNLIPFIYDKVSNTFSLPCKARSLLNYWGAIVNDKISFFYEGITRCE